MRGVEGGERGVGGASTAPGPGEPSAFSWGRIRRGVPVLTPYTPSARGLGALIESHICLMREMREHQPGEAKHPPVPQNEKGQQHVRMYCIIFHYTTIVGRAVVSSQGQAIGTMEALLLRRLTACC